MLQEIKGRDDGRQDQSEARYEPERELTECT